MFSSKRDRELANNESLDKNAKLVILFLIQCKYVINLQNNANALRYSFLGSKETTFIFM